ncbi:MAG: AAA family ATPase [Actinomycetota bacterium]
MPACPSCGEENPERAKFCLACGSALTAAVSHETRKTVTILFCDLVDSTKLGERMDPESLRTLMSAYFDQMRAIIERHGGTVEKFIGDAVMAVFGIPAVHEDDALRAVRAAAEMRDAVGVLNEDLRERWDVELLTRTGVNRGPVGAGDAAGGQTLVTGDAVNVAARLEQAADDDEIVIGEVTHRLTHAALTAEAIAPLALKGKSERVGAFRLTGVHRNVAGTARRLDAPMIGRAAQLGALVDALRDVERGRACRMVTVLGDAGVGKSRLAEELIRRAGDAWVQLRGRCLPYGEGITFWPVAQAIRQAAGLAEDGSREDAEARLAEIAGEHTATQISKVLGLRTADVPAAELFGAVRHFFEALGRRDPVILVFDDLHWAQPTLLDLIDHLARWTADARVLLLCIARPEFAHAQPRWGHDVPDAHTLTIDPLGPEDSRVLIDGLLGSSGLPEAARARISEATDGNPLFVEELVAMLVDDGTLRREADRWTVTRDLSAIVIPPTISAILASRIERLQPEDRDQAQRASVQGQSFYVDALIALSPQPVAEKVRRHLDTLSETELIRPDRQDALGYETYRFRHILIRDAVYDSALKQFRAELHERFADWLEGAVRDRSSEYEEIIGYHLEQAFRLREELGAVHDAERDLARRAGAHLGHAGRRALELVDMPAATSLLGRAVRLLADHDPERSQLLPGLGEALLDTGDFDRARDVLDDAATRARDGGDASLEARTALVRADLDSLVDPEGWSERAEAAARHAIDVFGRADDERGLAQAYGMLSFVHIYRCRSADTAEAALAAAEHAHRAGAYGGRYLSAYASALLYGPTPAPEAIERIEELRSNEDLGQSAEATTLYTLGVLQAMRGQFDSGRELINRASLIDRQLGREVVGAMTTAETLADVELLAGNPEGAERDLREGFDALVELGERGYASTLAAMRARAFCEQERWEEARRYAETSASWADSDDIVSQVVWRGGKARALAHLGDVDEAAHLAGEAADLAATTDHINMHADALSDLSDVLVARGDADRAAAVLHQARDAYRRKDNEAALARLE